MGRMARAHFCSFLLAARIDEKIPLLQYTGTSRNEGAPRVGFTRGGLFHAQGIELFGWVGDSELLRQHEAERSKVTMPQVPSSRTGVRRERVQGERWRLERQHLPRQQRCTRGRQANGSWPGPANRKRRRARTEPERRCAGR